MIQHQHITIAEQAGALPPTERHPKASAVQRDNLNLSGAHYRRLVLSPMECSPSKNTVHWREKYINNYPVVQLARDI
jgi:hypothetical protein